MLQRMVRCTTHCNTRASALFHRVLQALQGTPAPARLSIVASD